MLMCALFLCTHVKRKQKWCMPEKITQDCTLFPALPRYLEWFKLFYSIYGFINGTVIYTHVCMYVCILVCILSFVYPNLHSHKQMLPFLVQGSNVQAEKCLIIIKLYREGKVK